MTRGVAGGGGEGSRGTPAPAGVIAAGEEGLLACVHCGFCLPACPTYTRLGDENDSPRGRLHLMRAVAEGRLDATSGAFQTHIDRCLGCRACEPVCPSGVPYGRLLELARAEAASVRRPPPLVRLLLRVFASPAMTGLALRAGRLLRATGLAALGVRLLPVRLERLRFALAMLAASAPLSWEPAADPEPGRRKGSADPDRPGAGSSTSGAPPSTPGAAPSTPGASPSTPAAPSSPPLAGLLRGCVQAGLFAPVNEATKRVLGANGVETVAVPGQVCCGALHSHGGDLERARALARRNVDAFEAARVDLVVVNAAGCGAAMKEYGHLLAGDPEYRARAVRLADRVRDVSEVLVARGPRPGGRLAVRVALDAPCHLLHAQGVADAPRRMLDAVPGLEVVEPERASECCGGAGIYGLTHRRLGARIGGDKVEAVLATDAPVAATGNPGCIMQIGAGLRMAGSEVAVVHPVEILDASYRRAGHYAAASSPEERGAHDGS